MTINNAAKAHGHRYTWGNSMIGNYCPKCQERDSIMHDVCLFDNEIPAYWVLPVGGYPDTRDDYLPADTKNDVRPGDYGYLDNPAVSVFSGDREPWNEDDPYPDYIVRFGPRSGIRWERA